MENRFNILQYTPKVDLKAKLSCIKQTKIEKSLNFKKKLKFARLRFLFILSHHIFFIRFSLLKADEHTKNVKK